MNDNDIAYIAGAVQSSEKTRNNIAALESGFFDAVNHDWMDDQLSKIRTHEQMHFIRTRESAKQGREALDEVQKHLGLSKGAKVRHEQNREKRTRINQRVRGLNKALRSSGVLESTESFYSHDGLYAQSERVHDSGKSRFYVMSREWSGQYRGQLIYKPRPCDAPDANTGDRYTEKLSARAVRKIFEAGAYVATCRGGFTTFLTLTFTPEQREKIFEGNITIGSEVSRFLDGAKKVYQRGFEYTAGTDSCQCDIEAAQAVVKVAGYGKTTPFHYIWVAECPANEDGEPNPHVHLLLNWSVEKAHFRAWAARLEKIWGHGFGKLERIRHADAASGYLIKAVGYAAKGQNANQGLIRGNRYNIARCSRAPGWDVLASFEAANMAAIIKECGYRLERWRRPAEREISRKNKKKEELIKASGIARKQNDEKTVSRLQRLIKSLEQESRDLKQRIKDRGVFARSNNTFSICFDGATAEAKMNDFLIWAAGARDWTMNTDDADFTAAKHYAIEQYESEYQRFLEHRADWQSLLNQGYPLTPDDAELDVYQSKQYQQWANYESLH